ncbi:MAG: hypothetical protein AAF409_10175 [Pseudomonadota bacterium]
MRRLFAAALISTIAQSALADDIQGEIGVSGGGLFQTGSPNRAASGTTVRVINLGGTFSVHLSEDVVVQTDTNITRFDTKVRGGQIGAPLAISDTTFSFDLQTGYVGDRFALGLVGGLTGLSSGERLRGGATGAVFLDQVTIRGDVLYRNASGEATNAIGGTLGVEYFLMPNLMLSADGGYTYVRSPDQNVFDLEAGDGIYQAGASIDYRFEGTPLTLGLSYGYITTDSPQIRGDLHMVLGRVSVAFGSESLQEYRQNGAPFGRRTRVLDIVLDGLL